MTPADAPDNAGGIYAFSVRTGVLLWQAEVGNVESDLVHYRDLAIGATPGGGLVAVKLEDGALAWRFTAEGEATGRQARGRTPAVRNGRVYLVGYDGAVYALDAESGEHFWRRDHGCQVSTEMVATDSDLWLGCADGRMLRLARADGEIKASLNVDSFAHSLQLMPNGDLLALVGSGALVRLAGDLTAFRWRYTTTGEWSSFRPLVLGDWVLVGNDDGVLHAVDLATGSKVWQRQLGGVLRGLGQSDKTIYVGSLSGELIAFEPEALIALEP